MITASPAIIIINQKLIFPIKIHIKKLKSSIIVQG